ncbi:ABC transporter substrate-binding protein [Aquipuribacter nitratireducens]|uniref:ABC transporter substrate-binding protein n=1 Tax=Aquipuribacter nitratireducens TaxID=650104 RepID=A0ABW0GJY5_9MICO
MRSTTRRAVRATRLGAVGVAAALVLAACAGDSGTSTDDASGEAGGGEGGGEEVLVFGASADPVVIDGAYVSDGESLRVVRSIFEGLVTTEPGGTEIVPQLATEWEASDDGLEWTFQLREGVTFHDGEPFDAEAVCYNFDRWYNFSGIQQSGNVSYYWQTVMGGYAENEDESLPESLYASCEATGDLEATITLTRPSSTFLSALSLPAFSIASPAALEEYGADEIGGSAEEPQFTGTYGTEHPTGTGPFQFESWERGSQLVLSRNDDYWGDPAIVQTLVFRPIADGPARRQALESGGIDGYDLVDPADVQALEDAGYQILRRPAFNVGYIGFQQTTPPLDNPQIRQAIAHAIDRENIISTNYPEGSTVATQFMPESVFGYAEDVTTYDYDPERARQLIEESGVTDLTIDFWYPTEVSRPYMPDPTANFQLIAEDLEAVGFTVNPIGAPWNPDFLDAALSGGAPMYLLGWTGDFGDPDNFVGTFFQAESPEWGYDNPELRDLLNQAEAETDEDARAELYQEANRIIMDDLPGLPYASTEPALAFRPGVEGFVPSPVQNEDFAVVSVEPAE